MHQRMRWQFILFVLAFFIPAGIVSIENCSVERTEVS